MSMEDYVPKFEERDGKKWLIKNENKDYLFKKLNALSIQAKALEEVEMVEVNLPDGRCLVASKDEIKNHKIVLTFHGETKYYYPITLWHEKSTFVPKPVNKFFD